MEASPTNSYEDITDKPELDKPEEQKKTHLHHIAWCLQ